jgi:hypothetical protein
MMEINATSSIRVGRTSLLRSSSPLSDRSFACARAREKQIDYRIGILSYNRIYDKFYLPLIKKRDFRFQWHLSEI